MNNIFGLIVASMVVLVMLLFVPLCILLVGTVTLWALNTIGVLLPFSFEKAFACGLIFSIMSNIFKLPSLINISISDTKKDEIRDIVKRLKKGE